MNIQQRAQKVLAEIDAKLSRWEQEVTPLPWTDDGEGRLWNKWSHEKTIADPKGYEGEHITLGRFDKEDFDFIAASRTLLPKSLEIIRDDIKAKLAFRKNAEGWYQGNGYAGVAIRFVDESLTTIFDQWEAAQ